MLYLYHPRFYYHQRPMRRYHIGATVNGWRVVSATGDAFVTVYTLRKGNATMTVTQPRGGADYDAA